MDVNYNRNVNSFNVNAIAHIILPDLTREQVWFFNSENVVYSVVNGQVIQVIQPVTKERND